MIIYQTVSGQLATPEDQKSQIHEYHEVIDDKVTCNVIGVRGAGPSIRSIILSDNCDVSDLESWLGSTLKADNPDRSTTLE